MEGMDWMHCDEELTWDVPIAWLRQVRALIEGNGDWEWSPSSGTPKPVPFSAESRKTEINELVELAVLPRLSWILAADLKKQMVVLLVHMVPSFFIYPTDPHCDWDLVRTVLNKYTQRVEEKKRVVTFQPTVIVSDGIRCNEPGCLQIYDIFGRDQSTTAASVDSRGHYLAHTPPPSDLHYFMPSNGDCERDEQVQGVYIDNGNGELGVNTPDEFRYQRFFASLSETHSPRGLIPSSGN